MMQVSGPDAEAGFIDTVSRNLQEGRFLLLIVGDGIRSDLESMAELLGAHPNLGFHLELVEMRPYHLPTDGSLLIVPSMVGRTTEVRRATVSVTRDEHGEVSVIVEAPPAEPQASARPIASLEEFVARSTELVGQPRAEAMASIVDWWRTEQGSPIKFNRQSITLSSPYRRSGGRGLSVANLYIGGSIQGCVAPMAKTQRIISHEEALEHFRAAGFVGGRDPDWPSLDGDPQRRTNGIGSLSCSRGRTTSSEQRTAPPAPTPRGVSSVLRTAQTVREIELGAIPVRQRPVSSCRCGDPRPGLASDVRRRKAGGPLRPRPRSGRW